MIYWCKMCVSVLISYQKCPHSRLVSVELKDGFCKGALNKMALLMLQDGRRNLTRSDRQHFSCTTTLRHRGECCARRV